MIRPTWRTRCARICGAPDTRMLASDYPGARANLSDVMKWLVRGSIPIAAILVPAAFFLSVLSPDAAAPNALIYLAYVGAVLLAVGVLILGLGLVRLRAWR